MTEVRNDNTVSRPLVYLLFAVTTFFVAWNYGTEIFSGVSIYYNEGPLLEQAMQLLQGQSIYRTDVSAPPYTVSNYGPLFHLLQLPFLAMFGPSFVSGRIISVLGHLASVWFAGLIMRRLTGSAGAGLVTGLLVLASPSVGAMMQLYRVDPLAQALSLAGLYAALFMSGRRGIWAATLLFTAAIYSKQIYGLTAPGTAFLYLLLQKETRRAWLLAMMTAIFTMSVFAVGQWMTGGGFGFHLVTANINEYFGYRFLSHFCNALILSCVGIPAILLAMLRKYSQASARQFCLLYFAGAMTVALSVGKHGSHMGYFSELQVAFAFWIGLLATSPSRFRPAKPANELHVLLAVQVLFYCYFLYYSLYHVTLRVRHESQTYLQRLVVETPGPVLADRNMGMVVMAGKPIYFQPFEMVQLWKAGHGSQEAFLEDLRRRKFGLILIENIHGAGRWTPEMMEIIRTQYRLTDTVDDTMIWMPRRPPED